MAYKRHLTPQHRQKISDGVRRAWARIPMDDSKELFLNVNYDPNNKDNYKVFTDDGTELKGDL